MTSGFIGGTDIITRTLGRMLVDKLFGENPKNSVGNENSIFDPSAKDSKKDEKFFEVFLKYASEDPMIELFAKEIKKARTKSDQPNPEELKSLLDDAMKARIKSNQPNPEEELKSLIDDAIKSMTKADLAKLKDSLAKNGITEFMNKDVSTFDDKA